MLGALGASLGIAALIDIRERRIPNILCAVTATVGLTLAATGVTNITLLSSVAGLTLGLALMLPGHIFGGTGAGDV